MCKAPAARRVGLGQETIHGVDPSSIGAHMTKRTKIVGMSVLAAGLLVLPAPSRVQTPAEGGGRCPALNFRGSVTHADGPFNPDGSYGTLDSGALSCSGKPRNC